MKYKVIEQKVEHPNKHPIGYREFRVLFKKWYYLRWVYDSWTFYYYDAALKRLIRLRDNIVIT